jgi:hypothetical protein
MKAIPDIFDKTLAHDVTLEEAKQLDCCKDLTDEQVLELIEAVIVLTEMVYSVHAKKKAQQQDQSWDNSELKMAA